MKRTISSPPSVARPTMSRISFFVIPREAVEAERVAPLVSVRVILARMADLGPILATVIIRLTGELFG